MSLLLTQLFWWSPCEWRKTRNNPIKQMKSFFPVKYIAFSSKFKKNATQFNCVAYFQVKQAIQWDKTTGDSLEADWMISRMEPVELNKFSDITQKTKVSTKTNCCGFQKQTLFLVVIIMWTDELCTIKPQQHQVWFCVFQISLSRLSLLHILCLFPSVFDFYYWHLATDCLSCLYSPTQTHNVCVAAHYHGCVNMFVSQINPIAQLKIFFRRDAAVVLCPLDRHAVLDVVCVLRNEVSQQACLCFGDELLKFPSLNVLSLPFLKHLSRSQTSHSIEATNSVSFKGTAHPKMSLFVSLFTHWCIFKQF